MRIPDLEFDSAYFLVCCRHQPGQPAAQRDEGPAQPGRRVTGTLNHALQVPQYNAVLARPTWAWDNPRTTAVTGGRRPAAVPASDLDNDIPALPVGGGTTCSSAARDDSPRCKRLGRPPVTADGPDQEVTGRTSAAGPVHPHRRAAQPKLNELQLRWFEPVAEGHRHREWTAPRPHCTFYDWYRALRADHQLSVHRRHPEDLLFGGRGGRGFADDGTLSTAKRPAPPGSDAVLWVPGGRTICGRSQDQ